MMDNQLTTSCRDCVFANYIGKTQTDCKLGRIEKFKKKGIDIIEAEDLEENEFYVVEAWCNYYREKKWQEDVENHVDDLQAQVKREAVFPVGFIVLFDKTHTLDQLEYTVSSINNMEGEASYVVVANSSKLDDVDVITKVQELFEDSEIDYKITRIMDEEYEEGQIIDAAFANVGNSYYCVLKSGDGTDKDIISLIDNQTNTELEPVVYIKGENGISNSVIQSTMHKFLNGNYGMSLLDKIEGIQSEDGSTKSVVWTWEEIKNGRA